MKRLIAVLSLGVAIAMGQTITPIADIQYVADPGTNDASPLDGTTVTISGVVTAEPWGTYGNRTMFVQDADTAWSGIQVYTSGLTDVITYDVGVNRVYIAEGDSVTVTGTVDEYYGLTELASVTACVVHGKAANFPAPILLTPGEAGAEKYEGVLVTVEDVTVADPDLGYGEWSFTDGSDTLGTDDAWYYYYYPKEGEGIASITGPMTYAYGAYKLLPRLARDVVEAGPYTRVQRIQQVLGSDLLMTPDSTETDKSYFYGDTVSCVGIVTVPTSEISGIDSTVTPWTGYMRFIWQDPNGGPYSSIMSYFGDPTAFPELFEGDSVIMTGYIFEYEVPYPANFTEMFITEPVTIAGAGATIPPRDVITTGDLRLPLTAEQWELNMVRIENATMVDNNLPYAEFAIDDGTGRINADGDATNSMWGSDVYGNPTEEGAFVRPPNGTTIQSIEGYIYHAYGSYSDSTTYKINPVYHSDVVLGGGPPTITQFAIAESPFGPSDAVTVSANIVDGSDVETAVITYRVDGGAWTEVSMTAGASDVWSGTIPATGTEGALVEYFIKATDDGLDNQDAPMSTFFPPDTSKKLYGYFCLAAGPTIADLQYSAFPSGASYYDLAIVTATGVVTTIVSDGSPGTNFVIQSEPTAGYGILCNSDDDYVPVLGDNVTVTGTLDEEWAEWTYKYGSNTLIREITEVVVNSSGDHMSPIAIAASDLEADPEAYEGCLITSGQVTVTSINSYDWTVSDGTGEFLIDDDWADFSSDSLMGELAVDDVIPGITGIWNYSFGTFKVQIRDMNDFESTVGVVEGRELPIRFALNQNYPNPFNPTTTIEYSLAREVKHTLKVYNLRGALVATLVNDVRPAGKYSVTWNARDFASGMYFLRLDAGDFHSTKKLVLLK